MGSFASAAYRLILGWLRTAAYWLWSAFTGGQGAGWLAWLGSNWKTVALLLIAAGTVIDIVVYLFRWRPIAVWKSFFRRLRGEGIEAEDLAERERQKRLRAEEEALERETMDEWAYADGSVAYAPPQVQPQPEESVDTQDGWDSGYGEDLSAVSRLRYQNDEYPAQPPRETEEGRRTRRSERRASLLRKVAGTLDLGTDDDANDLKLKYRPTEPPVDAKAAYQDPVYPPDWREHAHGQNRK